MSKIGTSIERVDQSVIFWTGEWVKGVTANGQKVFLLDDTNVLKLSCDDYIILHKSLN
jgi:hypothetical protein